MAVEVSTDQVVIEILRPIVESVKVQSRACDRFNDLPDIPWHRREQLRTLQGKLDGIDQWILETFDRHPLSPEMEAFIDEVWPVEGE